ncbi:MAG: translation elongation factor Ts [Phycisphaerae bacterium]
MTAISAKEVQALRSATGLAMMDCKKALVEAEGDTTRAKDILRKKFADKMSERAARETANGRIGVHADDRGAALLELRCETDFVATNTDFASLADQLAAHVSSSGIVDVEAYLASRMADGKSVQECLVDAFGRIKENLQVSRMKRLEGFGAGYVHHNGRVAAAIACDGSPGDAGRQICMHIASTPVILGLVREDVDGKLVTEAREKAREEAKGKPDAIVEKIVDGKMNKWFGERVLVEQPFVMDDKKTVGAFSKENGFSITAFIKYEVGVMD